MNDKSVLGDLPEGVDSAMFLRDGWPLAVVCKVVMKDRGRVGIGIVRSGPRRTPEEMDAMALAQALHYVDENPPDYTEIQEHVAKMAAAAQERTRKDAIHDAGEEPDHDLQACLGHPARG